MKTKKYIVLFFLITNIIFSQVNPDEHIVEGYITKSGKIVEPYYRTDRNSTNVDNFGTKPNINPHTLKPGYINPDSNLNNTNTLIYVPYNQYINNNNNPLGVII